MGEVRHPHLRHDRARQVWRHHGRPALVHSPAPPANPCVHACHMAMARCPVLADLPAFPGWNLSLSVYGACFCCWPCSSALEVHCRPSATAHQGPYFGSAACMCREIHQDLPYGTMADDEMRRLNIGALQDEGVIFLWVTGTCLHACYRTLFVLPSCSQHDACNRCMSNHVIYCTQHDPLVTCTMPACTLPSA